MKQRVLIIDDSRDVRMILNVRLRRAGCDVSEAADGVIGLQQLDDGGQFDLILLDLEMPRMGGLEFLEHWSNAPTTRPPVVVMTHRDDDEGRNRALALGAADYMSKSDVLRAQFAPVMQRFIAA